VVRLEFAVEHPERHTRTLVRVSGKCHTPHLPSRHPTKGGQVWSG
jgi:hypothetical protein